MAFFSIIVPVYNVEKYLHQCIDSVINQTFADFELLLIDDGSPDNSGTLCDQYGKADQRIHVVHKENGGLSSARNCGLRIAAGEFVVFLDSDDYWDNVHALELIHREAMEAQADVILMKHRKLDMEDGRVHPCYNQSRTDDIIAFGYADQLKYCVSNQLFDTCAWNKVFRRSLMERQNLFFTEGIIAEDLDWVARLSLVATRLAIVEEPVHIYRKGRPGSITTSLKLKNLIDTKESIERCLSYVSASEESADFLAAYFGYIAYRYVIWMAESAALDDQQKMPLIQEMKRHVWLLNCSLNRKVKIVQVLTHFLGFTVTSKLLGLYLIYKK